MPSTPRVLRYVSVILAAAAVAARSSAAPPSPPDGPADNIPDRVRPIPPKGIELTADQRQELEGPLNELRQAIDRLAKKNDPRIDALLTDILIFDRAVSTALRENEFFAPADLPRARALLREGRARAEQLEQGNAPWTTATGLVVRGYRSRIDGSVQPYGLVVPESYNPRSAGRYRLDLWFHGRGETLSEVNFLDQRMKQKGEFTPADTFVLHPYGRYCNAFKFAGEVDVLEALDDVRQRYRIDDDRIAARGFSMGGAACWQFAVHYADRWFAANPGAGFAETPRFLNVFQNETLQPTWYEKRLWHLYDCTDYAGNLLQCPTVAYSGEIDRQKQAADVMAEALAQRHVTLTHIIGPQTAHRYHPDAKIEVERRLDALARRGRVPTPPFVDLTTYTLKYNRMNWVTIDALEEHWREAYVVAEIKGQAEVLLSCGNVTALTLDMPSGEAPFDPQKRVRVVLARGPRGQERIEAEIEVPGPQSDRSWRAQFHWDGGSWKTGPQPATGLQKRHDLQGPIDDAFMEPFLFVLPGGHATPEAIDRWVDQESQRAVIRWRKQFRGEPRVKKDSEVTDSDLASWNLVLWGDPRSNAVLGKVAGKLPIRWSEEGIQVGDQRYDARHHVPILIYPNPLNPARYVVINSGFTYREYDDLNNARQVPKLPDWAIVDVRTAPSSRFPGKVVAADFFGESWELKSHQP